MSWTFDRAAVRAFRFTSKRFDPATGEAELGYAFVNHDGSTSPELIERVTVPGAPFTAVQPGAADFNAAKASAVEAALRLLHLVAGVSYYKAAAPSVIECADGPLDATTADFVASVYENGLGEFAYRNGLDLRGHLAWPRGGGALAAAPALGLARPPASAGPIDAWPSRALVAIGGGKDSLVSIEALRALGAQPTVTWIGSSPLIRACAERTGLPTLNITRALAPELFAFNREGALNGHIPVTAVNSAILVFAALLTGHGSVVFSNEHSASYGSLIPGTGEVNHQWSKGWAFERDFAAIVRAQIAADFDYVSLLRPFSELAVARQFAKLDHYDAHFSSCNRNFHLLGEKPTQRWCGQCPKCHFVFLALAPFMPKPRLLGIFGRNLLDDATLAPEYDALLEIEGHKPFECVGEGRESRAAMAALAASPAWREDALVARFAAQQQPALDAATLHLEGLLAPQGEHGLGTKRMEALLAHFGA
ncbi:MAG: UDP-N-acetyl-alpha-D-muramoyl-L-alanyl-L-glutamate epimerase [Silanimonas sp.]